MEIVKQIKSVKEQAEQELLEENQKVAKEKLKSKMRELDKAKLVVRNIERELEDLMVELSL